MGTGLPAAHRSFEELQAAYAAMSAPPVDVGQVASIVCRRAPGVHDALERACLTPEYGVPGDEWNRRKPSRPDAQLAVMRRDVANLIGCGRPLTTSGDNLIVELDISAANLPVQTRLRVGEAVVEVTPMPHNGCRKFAERFGEGALRFVQAPATRHYNLRGIYWRVVSAGEVWTGAEIRVLSRIH